MAQPYTPTDTKLPTQKQHTHTPTKKKHVVSEVCSHQRAQVRLLGIEDDASVAPLLILDQHEMVGHGGDDEDALQQQAPRMQGPGAYGSHPRW